MSYNEADTRAKLIDPAIKARGWTEDFIHREITPARTEAVGAKGRRRGSGRTDYLLRYRLNRSTQGVPLALIEAKAEAASPGLGLEQVKRYRAPLQCPVRLLLQWPPLRRVRPHHRPDGATETAG